MEQHGCRRSNLIAKLSGGKSGQNEKPRRNIGTRNAEPAQKMWSEAGIHVIAYDLPGSFGTKLSFDTETNTILIKRHKMEQANSRLCD